MSVHGFEYTNMLNALNEVNKNPTALKNIKASDRMIVKAALEALKDPEADASHSYQTINDATQILKDSIHQTPSKKSSLTDKIQKSWHNRTGGRVSSAELSKVVSEGQGNLYVRKGIHHSDENDLTKAFQNYTNARLMHKNPEASYRLAEIISQAKPPKGSDILIQDLARNYKGKETFRNNNELAAHLLIKEAATRGHPTAQRTMGDYYHKLGQNKRAEAWYAKAAKQGDDLAQRNLSELKKAPAKEPIAKESKAGKLTPSKDLFGGIHPQEDSDEESDNDYVVRF